MKNYFLRKKSHKEGYSALVTVILISLMLSSFILASSIRYSNVEELVIQFFRKTEARNLAQTCAEVALQKISENAEYKGLEEFILNQEESCMIKNIEAGQDTFIVYSASNPEDTGTSALLKTVIDSKKFSIISQTKF
jgi:hypothetical protein